MQFVHQSLAWGFLIALVPLLIHLINLVRRRRIKWAAMDFLLQSYRRHRTWIWLQQLLLLLLRMAAIAVVVAMVAQWITQRQWFALLGGRPTHHYVLLDDSFSMGERTGGESAFDRAFEALRSIATRAMQQETPQKLTLLRFSRAEAADENRGPFAQLDLHAEAVDGNFDLTLEDPPA